MKALFSKMRQKENPNFSFDQEKEGCEEKQTCYFLMIPLMMRPLRCLRAEKKRS